jgi:hypothetical protein
LRKGIANNFNAFKVERADGALMGPWNPWLHEPAVGKAIWDLTLAMTANASLPDNVLYPAHILFSNHMRSKRAGLNEPRLESGHPRLLKNGRP